MNLENADRLVVLAFGYHLRLVVQLKTAIRIMDILVDENVMMLDTSYKNSVTTNIIKPWGTEEIAIKHISPAEILLRTAAAEGA